MYHPVARSPVLLVDSDLLDEAMHPHADSVTCHESIAEYAT